MSEEMNTQTENKEKFEQNRRFTVVVVLLVLSLLFSITALGLSIFTLNGGKINLQHKAVVISEQYDKGQSLDLALETKKPMIVFFYTDWCGYCQKFIPTFSKVTKDSKIKSNFAIAYVNCEKPENAKIIEEYGVNGFPTVFVVDKEGKKTHLDNADFFNHDSKTTIKNKALELIEAK